MKKLFFCFLILCSVPVLAQELKLAEEHVPQTAEFGKPFDVRFVLSHTPENTVQINPEKMSEEFPLSAQKKEELSPDTTVWTLTVLPLTLNKSTFTAAFDLTDGTKTVAQLTQDYPVTVNKTKIFNDKDLREIRSPHLPWSWLLWVLLVLAVAAAVGAWIWYQNRQKRPNTKQIQKFIDNRPPHVIALSQINALIDSGLWEKKAYKVFYLTLSDILREYLTRRFGLDVSADTSLELLRRAKTMPELEPLLPHFRSFLSSGDLVKFAKAVPSEPERNQDIKELEEIIRQTTPVPPVPEQKEKIQK